MQRAESINGIVDFGLRIGKEAVPSKGAFTVEINLEVTPASGAVDLSIQGPAETILRKIEDLLGTFDTMHT
jgi:hypothetical protein